MASMNLSDMSDDIIELIILGSASFRGLDRGLASESGGLALFDHIRFAAVSRRYRRITQDLIDRAWATTLATRPHLEPGGTLVASCAFGPLAYLHVTIRLASMYDREYRERCIDTPIPKTRLIYRRLVRDDHREDKCTYVTVAAVARVGRVLDVACRSFDGDLGLLDFAHAVSTAPELFDVLGSAFGAHPAHLLAPMLTDDTWVNVAIGGLEDTLRSHLGSASATWLRDVANALVRWDIERMGDPAACPLWYGTLRTTYARMSEYADLSDEYIDRGCERGARALIERDNETMLMYSPEPLGSVMERVMLSFVRSYDSVVGAVRDWDGWPSIGKMTAAMRTWTRHRTDPAVGERLRAMIRIQDPDIDTARPEILDAIDEVMAGSA